VVQGCRADWRTSALHLSVRILHMCVSLQMCVCVCARARTPVSSAPVRLFQLCAPQASLFLSPSLSLSLCKHRQCTGAYWKKALEEGVAGGS
jgi:hypothetical protein